MSSNESSLISWKGLVGATVTVLVTTLDDSIWLLPFVGTSSLPSRIRLINATTFLTTLVTLAILCCIVALIIQKSVSVKSELESEELEIKLQWIAVILCWTLAIGFFIKKQMKKRRRRQKQEQALKEKKHEPEYGSLILEEQWQSITDESKDEIQSISVAQPWTILSLTTLGFLDEISYFPALIIGDIFSPVELILSTLIAGLIMLGIQVFVASQFKPFIDWLDDHVKLHGIIAVFATILTIQLVFEIRGLDKED